MLKIITAISLLIFSLSLSAEELNDEKKKLIDEMLQVSGAAKLGDMMGSWASGQLISALQRQNKEVDTKTITIIQDEIGKLMNEEFIHNGFVNNMSYDIYHKYFSLSELKEMVAFYKTETGKKVAAVLPKITQESMQASQQHGMSLTGKIQQRIQARFAKEGIELSE
ncbi:DUF2059 domain-containing protein [Paraglaciecola sp. L3A3]|uniref:DUF2059 domain-containing protein n=1 Tax=Paraglaciecola sp. L3A3 TaxID=2686358 RepID=UPI00131CC532|nr:DUF2059 domain-containing protein [Paraglaciecola sp. L3A3]